MFYIYKNKDKIGCLWLLMYKYTYNISALQVTETQLVMYFSCFINHRFLYRCGVNVA